MYYEAAHYFKQSYKKRKKTAINTKSLFSFWLEIFTWQVNNERCLFLISYRREDAFLYGDENTKTKAYPIWNIDSLICICSQDSTSIDIEATFSKLN